MENYIIIGVVLVTVALAALYVIRTKKKGRKCIGCPGGCNGSCPGCKAREE